MPSVWWLSDALLLLLLGVVAVGAGSTLALTTASRRDEFTLLHRTGTTRPAGSLG